MAKLKSARVVSVILAALSFLLGYEGFKLIKSSFQGDFIYRKDISQEYLMARAIWAREDPYRPIPEMVRDYIQEDTSGFNVLPHPTPHPPSLALFLLPIGGLDYITFVYLWLAIECILLIVSIYSLLGWVDIPSLEFWTPVLTIALLGWIPVALDLSYGQLSIPLLFLVSCFWLKLRNGQSFIAGILLGLSIALKIMVWPLSLLLLFRRNWRALGGCVLVVLVSNFAALVILGVQPVLTYYTQVAGTVSSYYRGYAFNHSIHTLGWRLFHGTGSNILSGISAEPLFMSTSLAKFVSLSLPLGLLVWTSLIVRKHIDLDLELAFTLCVSVLVSPVAWIHYFVLLIVPLVILAERSMRMTIQRKDTLYFIVVSSLVLFMYDQRIAEVILAMGFEKASEDIVVPFSVSLLTFLPMIEVLLLCLLIYRFLNLESMLVITVDEDREE